MDGATRPLQSQVMSEKVKIVVTCVFSCFLIIHFGLSA